MKKTNHLPSRRRPSRAARVRPQAVRVDVDERRERNRERNRVYQRKYRERQRTLVNDRKSRFDPLMEQELPSYLPAHQKKAVDDFLDRLCCTENVPNVCSTCRESYHGMQMNGSQCERCFNEVYFFGTECSFSFFLTRVHYM